MYKGGVITILREVPGYIGLFATYELLKNGFISRNKDHKFTLLANMMCGSFSGVFCWALSYP